MVSGPWPGPIPSQRSLSSWASLVAQTIKSLPAMQETWVQSLGQKDSPENEMATHSSILAWRIPQTEKPGRVLLWGHKELDMTEHLTHTEFNA